MDSGERRHRVAMALGIEYPRNLANFSSQVSNPHSPSSRPRLGRMSSYHEIPRNSNRAADKVNTALGQKNKSSRAIQDHLGHTFHPKLSVSPFEDEYEAFLGPTYDVTDNLATYEIRHARQSSRLTPKDSGPIKPMTQVRQAMDRNNNLYSKLHEKNGDLLHQLGSARKAKDLDFAEGMERKPTVSLYAPPAKRIATENLGGRVKTNAFTNISSMRLRPETNLETQESISSRPDSITERYKLNKEGFDSLQRTGELKSKAPSVTRPMTGSLIEDLRSFPAVISPRNQRLSNPTKQEGVQPLKFKPMGLFSKKSVKEELLDRKLTFAVPKDEINVWSIPPSVAKIALEESLSDDGNLEVESERLPNRTLFGATGISKIFDKSRTKEGSQSQAGTQRGEIQRKRGK